MIVAVFLLLMNVSFLWAQEQLSKEDEEIIRDFEFFENAEIFLNSDSGLLQHYDDVENLKDEGNDNADETH